LAAKQTLPAILLANDLLDGEVVFWTGAAWSRDPAEALVARSAEEAEALERAAAAASAANLVVDAYLVDVTVGEGGLAVPNHFRERFKIRGPSIRPDLGKQAAYTHLSGSL
jgi:sulfite reductase (NADPH) hemoprotein beta-component